MNIEFTEEAMERFSENSWKHESLNNCIINLLRWTGKGKIVVMTDFGEKDFFFQEVDENGKNRMCGGIIFHRNWVKKDDGTSVQADNPDDGKYSTHT